MTTTTLPDLSDLLLRLYRAARELPIDIFQRSALMLVQPQFRFDSSMWGSGFSVEQGIDIHHIHLLREPPEMLCTYADFKEKGAAIFDLRRRTGGNINFNRQKKFQGPAVLGIRGYTRRFRHENTLTAADLRAEDELERWASLYRADPDGQYTEQERQLCALLFPHLVEALAINRLVHLEHLAPAGAMRRYHLAIADRHGVLYHSEPGFLDLLNREVVGAPHKGIPESVLSNLQRGHAFKGRAIVLLARAEGDLFFLKVRPRVLADGLSPREIQVAREVARGRTYKEIACHLHMSPSTARNHIHAIHAKLQVDNKASLTTQLQLIE